MAYVFHVEKANGVGKGKGGVKRINLGDLYRHNERLGKYADAEHIDKSLMSENYSLDDWKKAVSYEKRVEALVALRGARKPRSDSATVASMIVSASESEMESMTRDEQRAYFEAMKEELDDRFGSDSLVYAEVHMDEKTPHMHIGYVPFEEKAEGKTSVKWNGPVTRDWLRYMQNDVPQKLIARGFNIEIGDKNSVEHVETAVYRKVMRERVEPSIKREKDSINAQLIDRHHKYLERSGAVTKREAEVKAQQAELDKRQAALDERQEELEKREAEAAEAERVRLAAQAAYDSRQRELKDKERELKKREKRTRELRYEHLGRAKAVLELHGGNANLYDVMIHDKRLPPEAYGTVISLAVHSSVYTRAKDRSFKGLSDLSLKDIDDISREYDAVEGFEGLSEQYANAYRKVFAKASSEGVQDNHGRGRGMIAATSKRKTQDKQSGRGR